MSWIREPNAEPIPGYRLIEPLGSGGFGEVWKCEAPGGLFKAIKFVFGNLNSLDVDCVRAEQEQKALSRIKDVRHPFVCSLDLIRVIEGELVIVMELAERTLHDLFVECQNAGMIGIPKDNLMRYLRDASEALDYMNEKHNLQHLDVKPKNLFICGDRIKVADFGLVKSLDRGSSGMLGGVTPLYAPPETFAGKISPFSDQYSLAIVYQEMLTGHRPFQAKNVRQLAQQHLQEAPDLRSLPEHERTIIGKALSKDPTKRFPSCMAMMAALYKSYVPTRVEVKAAQAAPELAGMLRPKTMAETMEDIALEFRNPGEEVLAYDDVSEICDFGAPAPSPSTKTPRPILDEGAQAVQVSDLGVTVAQPETGALRPTRVIGLGSFGRKAILELRCRLMDRFGDLSKLPLIRFLAIDPDPEAATQAVRGAPQVALTRNEVINLPLQAVGNYRRRNLDHLYEWLPREKLYTMPRSLQTQGSRALGRLAFADNQHRLMSRLRREVQEVTQSDHIFESVSQTGLALRDTTPRIYVIAAAGGGSSGMVTDLGYAIKRLLAHLRHPDSPVHAFLMAGAPQDPATPRTELANVYATLTELNHYSDPSVLFAAQYGPDGQRIIDEGSPYTTTYLLPLAHRSPDALAETISHLGCYLFQEMTTPLGLRLDHLRTTEALTASALAQAGQLSCPLRSFGTYGVWFPRGLLLHLAAREASKQLIEQWSKSGETNLTQEARPEIERFVQRVANHPDLTSEALAQLIETSCVVGTPTDIATAPGEVLSSMLGKLDEQSMQPVAQDDTSNWAKQALHRIKEWVGSGEGEAELGEWRRTKLSRALSATTARIVEDWDQKWGREFVSLLEVPGARLAAAELAVERLQKWCQTQAEAQAVALREQAAEATLAWMKLQNAMQECMTGQSGFRLFGGNKKSRSIRNFLDILGQFARLRLAQEISISVKNAFTGLSGKLGDRGRDLGFCRQRLRYLMENLDYQRENDDEDEMSTTHAGELTPSHSASTSPDGLLDIIRQSATARVVLPDGEDDLERAALRFLQSLSVEHWQLLDKELSERVLVPRGGLHSACINSGDLTKNLALPLVREASVLLAHHLPIMDVADILLGECGEKSHGHSFSEQIKDYLDRAYPLITCKDKSHQRSFILVPASKAGRELAHKVEEIVKDVQLVKVPGQADLMFLREQGGLTAADLHKLLRPCQAAYQASNAAPSMSPHARFDVVDWLPLDP
ncbi:MAG: tubulin-like doman-containing protein [Planctomycetota bacterium]